MNRTRIQIQLATQGDLECIAHCAREAYAKYVERMGCEPAPMHADFATLIDADQVYIARYENAFAGYIVFYSRCEHLHLENVAVLPKISGKGVGRVLVEYAEQVARDSKLNAVELYTNEAMTENIVMYENMGYEEKERKQQDGFARVFFRKPV
jgi:GNAT superfamily N-acetyltransferase